jgi:hypothetical protein
MILNILKVLVKSNYNFLIPQKKIIIFDGEGSNPQELKKILNLNDCFTLEVRPQNIKKIYINFKIIRKFLFFLLKEKQKISIAYYCALICNLNPKLILTRNDNQIYFSEVSRVLHKDYNFFAIQKSARYEYGEPFYKKENLKKIFIPELASFGEYEKDLFKKYNLPVNKFYVCGSMRLACYQEQQKNKNKEEEFDICLIDEASMGWDKIYEGFEAAVGKLAEFAFHYAKKNRKKIVFAGKRKDTKGIELSKKFYQKYISSDFELRVNTGWSSYDYIERSKVTIGMVSTLLREALGLKKKILSCNFTGHDAWNFPLTGVCQLNEKNFEKFEDRLNEILNYKYKTFEAKLSNKTSYLIYSDESLNTNQLLKKRISELIN